MNNDKDDPTFAAEADAELKALKEVLPGFSPIAGVASASTKPPQPADRAALVQKFREAMSWGMVYGEVLMPNQWDSERDKMAELFADRLGGCPKAPADEITRPYGHCSITGPAEDVAFVLRHLPDVDDETEAPGTQDGEALEEAMRLAHAYRTCRQENARDAARRLNDFLAPRLRPVAPEAPAPTSTTRQFTRR